MKMGISLFRKHEYDQVRKFPPDGNKLHDTWEEQQSAIERWMQNARVGGAIPVIIEISLAALYKHEEEHGDIPNGKQRVEWVSQLMSSE